VTLKFLLDTNIVSGPILKEPNPRLTRKIDKHSHESAIPAPVWHELISGIRRLPRGTKRTAITEYVQDVVGSSFPILAYDATSAAWHGEERARLEKLGKPSRFVDGQIAAIAHANDLILVTQNTRDFRKFEGLEVHNWSK
jgi:tRNA(fMet)-specific endonuclease VapC